MTLSDPTKWTMSSGSVSTASPGAIENWSYGSVLEYEFIIDPMNDEQLAAYDKVAPLLPDGLFAHNVRQIMSME